MLSAVSLHNFLPVSVYLFTPFGFLLLFFFFKRINTLTVGDPRNYNWEVSVNIHLPTAKHRKLSARQATLLDVFCKIRLLWYLIQKFSQFCQGNCKIVVFSTIALKKSLWKISSITSLLFDLRWLRWKKPINLQIHHEV